MPGTECRLNLVYGGGRFCLLSAGSRVCSFGSLPCESRLNKSQHLGGVRGHSDKSELVHDQAICNSVFERYFLCALAHHDMGFSFGDEILSPVLITADAAAQSSFSDCLQSTDQNCHVRLQNPPRHLQSTYSIITDSTGAIFCVSC